MKVKIKKLKDNAIIPTRESASSAGYDLYACLDKDEIVIEPNTNKLIGTGISLQIPEGYFSAIFARSGIASKQNLRPANCTGVIDSDYRGEYFIPLHNDSNEIRIIKNKERIAQLVILPYMPIEFEETDSLDETLRGDKGFGSTGK